MTSSVPIVSRIDKSNLESIIPAYIDTFAGYPWYESWSYSEVESLVEEAYNKYNFKGRAIYPDSKPRGFVFGYEVPEQDTDTVAFSQIKEDLAKIGWEDSFYLAECGVEQKFQKQGLGSMLVSSLKDDIDKLVFRTTNSYMIKVIENQFEQSVKSLIRDPVNEREWYGVMKK